MKTVIAKTNPDFKRAQLLPMNLNVLPPTTGRAARRFSELTPPQTSLRSPMTDIVVCASSVNPGSNPPAIRLLS